MLGRYGTSNEGAQLYLDNNGTLATSATGTGPSDDVHDVRFIDVNGDSRLDLACSTSDVGAKLFTNTGSGSFNSGAEWNDGSRDPKRIEVVDVDRDVDLDLLGFSTWFLVYHEGDGIDFVSTSTATCSEDSITR